ncbi:MAG: PcfJ domain-containing protein [Actinomycetota bacterium]
MFKRSKTTESVGAWRCRLMSEPPARNRRTREAFLLILRRVAATNARILPNTGSGGYDRFLSVALDMAGAWKQWQRPACTWEPQGRLPQDQLLDLARHLFAEYPVPRFLDAVFLNTTQHRYQSWFIHVGAGRNIRTAPEMTARLTSRMAHFVMEAPSSYSVTQAVRLGQVLGLGGNAALARAVIQTRLGSELCSEADEAFWLTALQWLVNHPEVSRGEVGPLIDFLRARRSQDGAFEMKGRSPAALQKLTAAWHLQLRRMPGGAARPLPASAVAPSFWETWDEQGRQWVVSELCSTYELHAEGAAMRHCVFSYADLALASQCSIWSMKTGHGGELERALTLEVRNAARKVVQARGCANREPTEEERSILTRWAREHGLRVTV